MANAILNAEASRKSQQELARLIEGVHADSKKIALVFGEAAQQTNLNSMKSMEEFFKGVVQQLDDIGEVLSTVGLAVDKYIEEVQEIDQDDLGIGE